MYCYYRCTIILRVKKDERTALEGFFLRYITWMEERGTKFRCIGSKTMKICDSYINVWPVEYRWTTICKHWHRKNYIISSPSMKSWKWEIFICWTGQGLLRSSTRHASVSSNKMLMRSAPTPRDGVPLLRPATPPSSGAVSWEMSGEPYHQDSHVINSLEVGGIWKSGGVVKEVIDHISEAVNSW